MTIDTFSLSIKFPEVFSRPAREDFHESDGEPEYCVRCDEGMGSPESEVARAFRDEMSQHLHDDGYPEKKHAYTKEKCAVVEELGSV